MSEDAMDLFGEASPESDTPPAERRPWVVFDTETSTLLNMKQKAEAPGQGRLASIAMIYTTPGLTVTRRERVFVRPDGWTMHPKATEVNGLTDEWLMEHGIPVKAALDLYEQAILDGYAFAAFNSQFDTKVMRGELARARRPKYREQTYHTCVMRKATGVCKLPKANGKGLKFPKLDEACAHFKIERMGAHTAMEDAFDALEVLRALDRIGIDITPTAYKAWPPEESPRLDEPPARGTPMTPWEER